MNLKRIVEEIELTEMELENLQGKLEILKLKKKKLSAQDNRADDAQLLRYAKIKSVALDNRANAKQVLRASGSEIMAKEDIYESSSPDSSGIKIVTPNTQKQSFHLVLPELYQGIYSNQFEAIRIIQSNPGIPHRKFSTGIEAKGSLADYHSKLKRTKRRTFLQTLVDKPAERPIMVPLGIEFRNPEEDEGNRGITFQQWKLFANIIRKDDGGDKYDRNKYFSVERGETSRYVILPGISAKLCYQLFQIGLVENIYPGKELTELEEFPTTFQRAIRTFQKRALKNSDRDIFLSINSSLPWWSDGQFKSPYHFVRLGTKARSQAFQQPKALEEFDYKEEDLAEERAQGLLNVFHESRRITPEVDVRVNYQTSKILMASYFNQPISKEDLAKAKRFQEPFVLNHLDVDDVTRKIFCEKANDPEDKDKHLCVYCVETSSLEEMDTFQVMLAT